MFAPSKALALKVRTVMLYALSVRMLALLCAFMAALAGPIASAQPQGVGGAGRIDGARGVVTVQPVRGPVQIGGRGLQLNEGDRISTGTDGIALILLNDGTRMTMRPNSQLVLETVRYVAARPAESSMVLGLLKGGFRAVTGLIAKAGPGTSQVRTATATLGIRGTEFDARLCEKDCASARPASAPAASAPQRAAPRNRVLAAARVVRMRGDLTARDANGRVRLLAEGGPVYPGDTVATADRSIAVLAFRDESKVTLASNTQFRVTDFVFDPKQPSEGRFVANLLQGGLRAFTGLVGKAQPANVSFRTATATIGVRGTGMDIFVEPGGTRVQTWDGIVVVQIGDRQIEVGVGVCTLEDKTTQCRIVPDELTRPDGVQVDFDTLFGTAEQDADAAGLYVQVRDGHIRIQVGDRFIDLGAGEVGFTDGRIVVRPAVVPPGIAFDGTPLPGDSLPNDIGSLFFNSGLDNRNVCTP
ncbi:FecR domain-containing protein [Piscinibacterium candidicorallinum]|uniref:FecR domain-containing protein n=1 Tax=Piscinibacterium candidicorallinum TaxID=1793872 RepID=A0ABV7H2M3_9BURK